MTDLGLAWDWLGNGLGMAWEWLGSNCVSPCMYIGNYVCICM